MRVCVSGVVVCVGLCIVVGWRLLILFVLFGVSWFGLVCSVCLVAYVAWLIVVLCWCV